MGKFREVLAVVEKSLGENQSDWDGNDYEIRNSKLGCSVWIANGYYGLEIRIPGKRYGDVTLLSTFFGWLTPWRRRILRKAKSAVPKADPETLFLSKVA